VFFIGSQIFLKNPKIPQSKLNLSRIFNKTPMKTTFKIPNAFFKSNNNNKQFLEKTTFQDIESLENKGVLTWESQISDDVSEPDTNRNRAEFLNTLNNLNKSEKTPNSPMLHLQNNRKMSQNSHTTTPGGILRRKAEEKEREKENSEKMLSFEQNSIEKTPKIGNKTANSPNKAKSKSISFSKHSNSPMKRRKFTNEDLFKYARKIQKAYRDFKNRNNSFMNSNNRNFKIIQHYPSYTLPQFFKKQQNIEKKPLNGSLLIIYYRKKANLRVIFKSVSVRKIYFHIFDFSELKDEKLRISLFDEFLNKVLGMLCLFGEALVFKSWALTSQKSQTIKINKFILEEIELISITEVSTKLSVPFLMNSAFKNEDMEPTFNNGKDDLILNSSHSSLHPLINDDYNSSENLGVFPLINQLGSLSDLSFVEPLINNDEPSNKDNNTPKIKNDDSRIEQILKEEAKILSTGGTENQELKISINLFTNEKTEDKLKRESMISERKSSIFSEIPIKSNQNIKQNPENKSKKEATAIIIQRKFRVFLAQKALKYAISRKFRLIKRHIIRKTRDIRIDFRIYSENHNKFLYFKAIFLRLSDHKTCIFEERNEKNSGFLSLILTFPNPLIWVKFNIETFQVSLQNPQFFQEGLTRFEAIFQKIPRKLKFLGWSGLFLNNKFSKTLINTLKFEETFHKLLRNSRQKNLAFLSFWSRSHDKVIDGTKRINRVFRKKKLRIWKQFVTKLSLIFELMTHLTRFCEASSRWIDKLETRRGYLKSFKKVFLFSKFKDCEFLEHRMLFYKKKTIETFCYFHPINEILLIYTLSSEVLQYEEKLDFALESKRAIIAAGFKPKNSLKTPETLSPSKLAISRSPGLTIEKSSINMDFIDENKKLEGKMAILKRKIKNITLIQDQNSINLKFKLYPEEYLTAAFIIQTFLYKKLYSKTFEFKDFKSGKIASAYILLHGNKIHLLLKNKPALMSSIYEISLEMCYFLRISQKIRILETFLSKGLFYSLDKKEVLFKEPAIPRVWLNKTVIFDGFTRRNLILELDLKAHKLLFRIENEEKFYKISLPALDLEEDSSLIELKEIVLKTLANTVILKESDDKYRIINDEDSYGPLMHKEEFHNLFNEKKLPSVLLRIIDIKKSFQLSIEVPEAFGMISLVTNAYIPYENEENKRLITDYLIKGIKENLQFDSLRGVVLKKEFLKGELDDFLRKNKLNVEIPLKTIKTSSLDSPMKKSELLNQKKAESHDENKEGKAENVEKKEKKNESRNNENKEKKAENMEKNEKKNESRNNENKEKKTENIEKNGKKNESRINENKEKKAENIEKNEKKNENIVENKIKQNDNNNINKKKEIVEEKKKPEEEPAVVLDGDIKDYERVALLIQNKYREKGGINLKKKKKPEIPEKKQEIPKEKKETEEKTPVLKEIAKENKGKNPEPEVILEGDIQDYEKVANMIQKKYRMKKSPIKKLEEKVEKKTANKAVQEGNTKETQKIEEISPKKPEPEVILEGDIQDYEKVANMIQKKYRMKKSPIKKPEEKIQEKPFPKKTEEKVLKKPEKTEEISPKKPEPEVILEGDIQDYEKVANMIQKKYRMKKSPIKKPEEKIQEKPVPKKTEEKVLKKPEKTEEISPKKPEPEVILEGDIQDYEKVANMIQKKYRMKKSPIKKSEEKIQEKPVPKKTEEKVLKKPEIEVIIEKQKNPPQKTEEISPKKPEPEVILEGDIQDYEKVANMIQKKYRMKKSPIKKPDAKIETIKKPEERIEKAKKPEDRIEKAKKSSPESIKKPLNEVKKGEKPQESEEVILEGDIADYEKAALKIQYKYRKKKAKKDEISPKTPTIEHSPPKPLISIENEQKPIVLEGDIHDYEQAALMIQAKFRKKHDSPKSKSKEIKSAANPIKSIKLEKNRHSLPSKAMNTDVDLMEESDKILGPNNDIGRKNSFKNKKRNLFFSKFKGRTFELQKQNMAENGENAEEKRIREENYKIRIFPAPEDMEIAVYYLQEWWRSVLKKRNWQGKETESFLEDIEVLTQKNN